LGRRYAALLISVSVSHSKSPNIGQTIGWFRSKLVVFLFEFPAFGITALFQFEVRNAPLPIN